MNFKRIKLITLVVVAGLLSLLNPATWTASGYSFEGPGLYKDGEKVLGFDLALPEGIARTISDDTDVGQEVSKKKQFILDARKRDCGRHPQTCKLEETNTALKVLMNQRIKDKTELEETVLLNAKELINRFKPLPLVVVP